MELKNLRSTTQYPLESIELLLSIPNDRLVAFYLNKSPWAVQQKRKVLLSKKIKFKPAVEFNLNKEQIGKVISRQAEYNWRTGEYFDSSKPWDVVGSVNSEKKEEQVKTIEEVGQVNPLTEMELRDFKVNVIEIPSDNSKIELTVFGQTLVLIGRNNIVVNSDERRIVIS